MCAISNYSTKDSVVNHIEDKSLIKYYQMTHGQTCKEDYGIKMDPTTLMVDKKGIVVSKSEGVVDLLEFKTNINLLC